MVISGCGSPALKAPETGCLIVFAARILHDFMQKRLRTGKLLCKNTVRETLEICPSVMELLREIGMEHRLF